MGLDTSSTCVWLQLSLLFMKTGSQMAHETVGRVLTADLSTQLLPITWHGVCSAETYCGFTEEKKEDILLPYNIHPVYRHQV